MKYQADICGKQQQLLLQTMVSISIGGPRKADIFYIQREELIVCAM